MRTLSFIFLLVLLGHSTLASAQEIASLNQPRVEITGHVATLLDVDRTLTINQVATADQAGKFVPVAGTLHREKLDAAVWLRFSVANVDRTNVEWWLEIQPAVLEQIALYAPDGKGGYAVRHGGSQWDFALRDVGYRNPVFKLTIPAGKAETFYVRIDSGIWKSARLTMWQPTAFLSAVGKEQLLFGLYIGIYVLLVFASLWFEWVMRDRVYLCFALYVTGCIFTTLTSTGLWQQYILPSHPEWFTIFYALSVTFLIGCCVQFFFFFIDMHRSRPRFTRAYLTINWLFCVCIFLTSVIGYHRQAMYLFGVTVATVIMPVSVLILWRPALRSVNVIRLTFVAGGTFLVTSFAYASLVRYQWLPQTWFSENAMYISSMVFFLIVFYAISRRYYAIRIQSELMQQKMLDISQRSEQELEKLVDMRTDELVRAKQSAEIALTHAQTVQQEQRRFIATVSHELRTPLAVIDATAQNLERETPDTALRGKARVTKIRQATKRLSVLFDDYLNDERFELFSQGIAPQEVDILPLLEDAAEAAQSLSDRHRFVVDAPADLKIWADPYGLRLMLRTLTDNAVKYSPYDGTVTLSAVEVKDGWHIDIADDGPSIPPDEREKIFERYYRGRGSSSRVGTGLGLTLARSFVQQHAGQLNLICASTGGNIFRIELPNPH